jgi:hypothetical protein
VAELKDRVSRLAEVGTVDCIEVVKAHTENGCTTTYHVFYEVGGRRCKATMFQERYHLDDFGGGRVVVDQEYSKVDALERQADKIIEHIQTRNHAAGRLRELLRAVGSLDGRGALGVDNSSRIVYISGT